MAFNGCHDLLFHNYIVIPSSYSCLLFVSKDNKIIGKKILKYKSCEQFSINPGSFDRLNK